MRERAVSTAVNYTVALLVVALLVSTLLAGTNALATGQQERAARGELEVLGHRLAGDVGAVDRLARRGGDTVRATVPMPDRVAGSTYRLAVVHAGGDRYELRFVTTDPEVTVTVGFRSLTPVRETRLSGGDLAVAYDPATGHVEVTDA